MSTPLNSEELLTTFLLQFDTSSIDLQQHEIDFIKKVVSSEPALLDEIFADGKITVSDIPNIVLLLSRLFTRYVVESDIEMNIIILVDTTATIFIDMIPMPHIERLVLIRILKFSIELLKTNLPAITRARKSCFRCLYDYLVGFFSFWCCCGQRKNTSLV